MSTYFYKAKSGPHDIVEGHIEAENEREAHQKLSRQGLFPIKVSSTSAAQTVRTAAPQTGKKKKWKGGIVRVGDLALFTFHLSNLISSGLTLSRALELLSEQFEHGLLADLCSKLHADIKQGTHFSDALEKYPRVFPPLLINTVRAGEAGGTLEDVLKNVSATYEREEETRSKVKQAFIYPGIVLTVAVVLVTVLLIFVVPNLTQMYDDLGQTLPLLTRIVVGLSDFVVDYWWVMLLMILGGGYFLRRAASKGAGKKALYNLILKIPLLGDVAMRSDMASFSRILSMLLASGVGILESLRVTESVMEIPAYAEEIVLARGEVTRGTPLSQALSQRNIFPKFVTQMIAIGEESGDMDGTLMRVSRTYDRDVARRLVLVTTILEPVLIVIIGLVVGVIIMAMLLPIFQINLMAA